MCCCLGAACSSGDAGVKAPDNRQHSSGGNSIYTSNTSPGGGQLDVSNRYTAAVQKTHTLFLRSALWFSTCLEHEQCNDLTSASFQIQCEETSASQPVCFHIGTRHTLVLCFWTAFSQFPPSLPTGNQTTIEVWCFCFTADLVTWTN